jgi:Family of unknown function (DUF5330)
MRKNFPTAQTLPSAIAGSHSGCAAHSAAGDLGVMFFLLRMAFWLGLVLILLPSGSSQQPPASEVGASDAISAASATVGDLRQFCSRQPDACTVGSQVATELGHRAQAGARMLYEYLTKKIKPNDAGTAGAGRPGGPTADASQNTLTPADLVAPWRGPLHKDPKQG